MQFADEDRVLNIHKSDWNVFLRSFVANSSQQVSKITKESFEFEQYPNKHIFVFRNVLSPEECQFFVDDTEKLGYEELVGYRKEYRSNTRVIVPNTLLAGEIWNRIKGEIPSTIEDRGAIWDAVSLNEQFRFCKYVNGQHFSPHYDADFARSSTEKSFLTFMIYLNDVVENDGGATVFLKPRHQVGRLKSINPSTGMVLCFSHDIYHEGEMFRGSAKYLMRSDVMYRKRDSSDETQAASPSKLAIARTKVSQAEALEAAGEHAKAADLYRQAYKMAPELERNT